jgi:outer membrane protein OmpA-like peptidoglycan-associated protein
VVGRTDTLCGFAYNMRLSERGAKATADQRVADGASQPVLGHRQAAPSGAPRN